MGEHCSLNNNNSQSEANPESGVTPILRNTAPVPQFSCPVWMRSLKMGSAHHWRHTLKAHIVGTHCRHIIEGTILFWKKTSPSFRFKSHSRRSKALLKDTFGNVTSWGLLSRNYPNETNWQFSSHVCLIQRKLALKNLTSGQEIVMTAMRRSSEKEVLGRDDHREGRTC